MLSISVELAFVIAVALFAAGWAIGRAGLLDRQDG